MRSCTLIGPIKFIPQEDDSVELTRQDAEGTWWCVGAVHYLSQIDDWMKQHRPESKVTKVKGSKFWHAQKP